MTANCDSMRVCTKCGESKPATTEFFRSSKLGKLGIRTNCRVCEAEYNKAQKKAHYHANAESERAKVADYRANNPDKVKEAQKRFYAANREKLVAKRAELYAANRDEIAERRRELYAASAERERQVQRERRAADPDRFRLRDREYRRNNLTQVRNKDRASSLRKFKRNYGVNVGFTLRVRLSSLLRASLKSGAKSKKMEALLGYSVQDLRLHLERGFKDSMTWDAFLSGKIHIDHIRPVSSFDITSDQCADFKACWALSNLQPLWAFDNLSKGAKILELA